MIVGGIENEFVRFMASGMFNGAVAEMQGGNFGSSFLAAGLGSLWGMGTEDTGLSFGKILGSAIVGGTASKLTGGKFGNGAVTSAFSTIIYGGGERKSNSPSDGVSKKVGACAEKNLCRYDDYSDELRAQINEDIQAELSQLKAMDPESMDEAAKILHNSKLVEISREWGIEVWARIDGETNKIYMAGTGFDFERAHGATGSSRNIHTPDLNYGDSVWHTHPSGGLAHIGDLYSLMQPGGDTIYASGKMLSRVRNPNHYGEVVNRRLPSSYSAAIEVLRNDEWEISHHESYAD